MGHPQDRHPSSDSHSVDPTSITTSSSSLAPSMDHPPPSPSSVTSSDSDNLVIATDSDASSISSQGEGRLRRSGRLLQKQEKSGQPLQPAIAEENQLHTPPASAKENPKHVETAEQVNPVLPQQCQGTEIEITKSDRPHKPTTDTSANAESAAPTPNVTQRTPEGGNRGQEKTGPVAPQAQGGPTQNRNQRTNRGRRVPPITVFETKGYTTLIGQIQGKLTGALSTTYKGDSIVYQATNPDDFQYLKQEFRKRNLEFFTYNDDPKSTLKVVVKRLTPYWTPEDVKNALAEKGFPVWEQSLQAAERNPEKFWGIIKARRQPHKANRPLHGQNGLVYTPEDKATAMSNTLELQFQENVIEDDEDEVDALEQRQRRVPAGNSHPRGAPAPANSRTKRRRGRRGRATGRAHSGAVVNPGQQQGNSNARNKEPQRHHRQPQNTAPAAKGNGGPAPHAAILQVPARQPAAPAAAHQAVAPPSPPQREARTAAQRVVAPPPAPLPRQAAPSAVPRTGRADQSAQPAPDQNSMADFPEPRWRQQRPTTAQQRPPRQQRPTTVQQQTPAALVDACQQNGGIRETGSGHVVGPRQDGDRIDRLLDTMQHMMARMSELMAAVHQDRHRVQAR
ncbi:serine/arginine repetitive matrix protein 1-like [Schistocerca cancellata]|uniref:serine/arginine repetitive matrix protein 1-like n=1 Tax=Schistocerca cancellata TaxID=274614 RepID=UPI002119062E|nr:serine/arginine repetitive matrix protein 1-like [Schistocerca cancellata]